MNLTEVIKKLEDVALVLQSNKERIENINIQMLNINYPEDYDKEEGDMVKQDSGTLDRIYLLIDCIKNTAVEQRIALDITESFL
jgi:hypothetical protein